MFPLPDAGEDLFCPIWNSEYHIRVSSRRFLKKIALFSEIIVFKFRVPGVPC